MSRLGKHLHQSLHALELKWAVDVVRLCEENMDVLAELMDQEGVEIWAEIIILFQKAGISPNEFTNALGTSANTIWSWTNAKFMPRSETRIAMINALIDVLRSRANFPANV